MHRCRSSFRDSTLAGQKFGLKLTREQLLNALYAGVIGTGVHQAALNFHWFYQERLGRREDDFPDAEFITNRTIYLFPSTEPSNRDVDDVVTAVRILFTFYAKCLARKEWSWIRSLARGTFTFFMAGFVPAIQEMPALDAVLDHRDEPGDDRVS